MTFFDDKIMNLNYKQKLQYRRFIIKKIQKDWQILPQNNKNNAQKRIWKKRLIIINRDLHIDQHLIKNRKNFNQPSPIIFCKKHFAISWDNPKVSSLSSLKLKRHESRVKRINNQIKNTQQQMDEIKRKLKKELYNDFIVLHQKNQKTIKIITDAFLIMTQYINLNNQYNNVNNKIFLTNLLHLIKPEINNMKLLCELNQEKEKLETRIANLEPLKAHIN